MLARFFSGYLSSHRVNFQSNVIETFEMIFKRMDGFMKIISHRTTNKIIDTLLQVLIGNFTQRILQLEEKYLLYL